MNIEALSSFEKDQLLRKLLHHMGPDVRGQIMEEMPVIYVKMAPQTAETVRTRVKVATERVLLEEARA
jgi:hypothetical protein